jgi:alpha,alpha-trehalose-phosphate synthase [UDP-forming]
MIRSVSGMVSGLEPVLASTHGMWIAWGTPHPLVCPGDVCRIPPENPTFDLKFVQLTPQEVEHYYLGFSNSTLWPLSHNFLGRARYDEADWQTYCEVNEKFAKVVASEVKTGDILWVNDYPMSLVPARLRALGVRARIGFFWHIPFPPLDIFRTLPWRREMLTGLLGADFIAFHCRSYQNNFLQAVEELLSMDVSFAKGLIRKKRPTYTAALPMGIDYRGIQKIVSMQKTREGARKLREEIGAEHIILGVDRLDYSKGITERLAAVEKFLEDNPSYIGKISFVQISVPTRVQLLDYVKMKIEVENAEARINERFSRRGWMPIHYYFRSLSFEELISYYLAADICLITPLRDGMNLIAKEYVASQDPGKGMLVLSEFAGAAEELKEAVIVNAYSIPSIVRGLKRALEMKPKERHARMDEMRRRLKRRDIKKWGEAFLKKLAVPSSDALTRNHK